LRAEQAALGCAVISTAVIERGSPPLNNTQSVKDVEQQLSGPGSDALVKSIGIPPRPAVLIELQKELDKDDPDLRTVARLVAGDVALTASMLRIVNSPAFGLSRP
jgi:hypothetical protein